MNLKLETGHETGIIVFDGGTVSVVNWAECNDNTLPMVVSNLPYAGPISWPWEYTILTLDHKTDDIREGLPGTIWMEEDGTYASDMDIIYDDNMDLKNLFLGRPQPWELKGKVYTLLYGNTSSRYEGKVIVPDCWN